jgi:hypothetical protein
MIYVPIFSYIKEIYSFQYMLKSNASVNYYYVELYIAFLQLENFFPYYFVLPVTCR